MRDIAGTRATHRAAQRQLSLRCAMRFTRSALRNTSTRSFATSVIGHFGTFSRTEVDKASDYPRADLNVINNGHFTIIFTYC